MVPMLQTVATNVVKYSVPDVVSQKLGRFFKKKQEAGAAKFHEARNLINKQSSNVVSKIKLSNQKNSDKRDKAA